MGHAAEATPKIHLTSESNPMKIAVLIARILMGLVFLVFGLNHIYPFLPMPPMPAGDMTTMMMLMFTHKWMLLYGFLEAASGAMLLAGRFVPLALTILGGIGVNILLFHLTLEPSGLPMPLVLMLLEVFLVYAYRRSFAGIFAATATPDV
jgi:putative oxidoreductase